MNSSQVNAEVFIRLGVYTHLVLQHRHVVVGGLRVKLRLSLKVNGQGLHVKPEIFGVGVILGWVAAG